MYKRTCCSVLVWHWIVGISLNLFAHSNFHLKQVDNWYYKKSSEFHRADNYLLKLDLAV